MSAPRRSRIADTAPRPTERDGQRALLAWLNLALPAGSIVHHVANQSAVDHSLPDHAIARYFGERRRDGVLDGFPDLLCLMPGHRAALLEVKRLRGGALSPAQSALHPLIRSLGFPVAVARTIEDAEAALRGAGVPLRQVRL